MANPRNGHRVAGPAARPARQPAVSGAWRASQQNQACVRRRRQVGRECVGAQRGQQGDRANEIQGRRTEGEGAAREYEAGNKGGPGPRPQQWQRALPLPPGCEVAERCWQARGEGGWSEESAGSEKKGEMGCRVLGRGHRMGHGQGSMEERAGTIKAAKVCVGRKEGRKCGQLQACALHTWAASLSSPLAARPHEKAGWLGSAGGTSIYWRHRRSAALRTARGGRAGGCWAD